MNKKKLIVAMFFIGVLLATIAGVLYYNGTDNFMTSLIIGISTGILSTVITNWFFGEEPEKIKQEILKTSELKNIVLNFGLENIFETRSDMNKVCNKHLYNTKEYEIIGFGLSSLRQSKAGNDIIEKVKKGELMVKFLTIDPDSPYVKQRAIDEAQASENIKKSIIDLINWVYKMKEKSPNKENVQIKVYKDALPLDFYCKEDDRIFVGPYFHNKASQKTISYELKSQSKGYEIYTDYFKSLWEDDEILKKLTHEEVESFLK